MIQTWLLYFGSQFAIIVSKTSKITEIDCLISLILISAGYKDYSQW